MHKIIFGIGAKAAPIVWDNRDKLNLLFKTKLGKYRNERIRLSLSYLYRIRIPDTEQYLLVLNTRIKNQLQPVGGVYKYKHKSSLFEELGVRHDNSNNGIGVDKRSSKDLRITVPGKNVIKFLKWFDSKKDREIHHIREFKEELIDTEILDKTIFDVGNLAYTHLYTHITKLKFSEFFNCHEILLYDILEFHPNDAQAEELRRLAELPNDLSKGYAIVSLNDIIRMSLWENNEQIARIGEHTKYTINENGK